MKHKKKPESAFLWWLALIIPIINLWGLWKVAKLLANHEAERGD